MIDKAERMAAKYFETKAVRFSTAENAVSLALGCLALNTDDEIIVSANLRSDISDFVQKSGVKVILGDVCENEFTADTEDILSKLSEKTKAIVISHRFGRFAELNIVGELKKRNITVIEECIGCIGSVCFSKNGLSRPGSCDISCIIETDYSVVLFKNPELEEKFPKSDLNSAEKFLSLLPNFEFEAGHHRLVASRYKLLVYENGLTSYIKLPLDDGNSFSATSAYAVRAKKRDELKNYLETCNIKCDIPDFAFENSACPQFETWKKELLLLPLNKEMTLDNQKKIIAKISSFYADKFGQLL